MKILFEYWSINEEEVKKNLYFLAQACNSNDVSIQHVLGYIDNIIKTWKRYKVESELITKVLNRCSSRHEDNYTYHNLIWEDKNFSAKKFFIKANKEQIQKSILINIR